MVSVPLAAIEDPQQFGEKAFRLGLAARAGLCVPPGVGLSLDAVARICRQAPNSSPETYAAVLKQLDGPVAVRSSVVGEDSQRASFAGRYQTELNVRDASSFDRAVRRVWNSVRSAAAVSYRERLGITAEPRAAVLVQRMVASVSAGVLFTRDPVFGTRAMVIEAAWGLGEAVVMGLVAPDVYRLSPTGEVLAERVGNKDLEVTVSPGGGVARTRVGHDRATHPCLTSAQLRSLVDLGNACEALLAGPADVEWAVDVDDGIQLLQLRPITALRESRS